MNLQPAGVASEAALSLDALRGIVGGWAASEPLIRRVYLFGSRARGPHQPYSDLDLAVLHDADREVLRQAGGHHGAARMLTWMDHGGRWRAALAARLPWPVDLQQISRGDGIVRPAIKREGVLLYTRVNPS